MLKLTPNPTFKTTVKLSVPGSETQEIISVTFRHKTREELRAWIADKERNVVDSLDEVIESWSGIQGDDGEVAYSKDSLVKLTSGYSAAAGEFVTEYIKQLTESRTKN
jgi:hypothetical protein